ncbi:MAG: urea ABC transporter ATP-binding subunit UrtE [Herbaspirillum sp.]
MLEVSTLNAFYGDSHIIKNISFNLQDHESIAIIGRNGMGKTTLLNSLIGMHPIRSGNIRLNGVELSNSPSYERVRHGLAFVPQGRMIFPYLTVEQNIMTGTEYSGYKSVPDYIYRFFPVLEDMKYRKGGNLSGGQQQMLAIARALVADPKVLILDEPTEGIQPSIIKELAKILRALSEERHFAIIVSEQLLSFVLDLADRFLVIDRGEIVHEEHRDALNESRLKSFLTV